jgi:hypothetical protein
MTRSTARMAGIGAGALLALGTFTAAPAGAADGAQADASVQLETQEAINQTLGLVNQACTDIATVGDAAASTLAAEHGITVSSESSAGILNLQVSLPALTDALPSLGSLPLLGSVVGEVDATRPLQISCAASAGGAGVGLTAAGVDVLVDAIAPGVDVSGLNLAIPAVDVPAVEIPAVDATASVNASGAALPADASVNATAARTLPATSGTPSARFGAAAPTSTTTSAAAEAAPATSDASVSGGTLARTGAGVGGLGLLGGALIGGGRLLAFGRKFLGIG